MTHPLTAHAQIPTAAPEHRPTRQRSRRTRLAILITATALVVAACSSGSSTTSSQAGTPTTSGALRTIKQSALEAAFAKGVAETNAPGGIAIVSTPQGRFTVRYGTGTVGTDTPLQPTDHFRIGSTTKTMVGAVILQLAQEGKLQLSDPVSKYRPDVPNGDRITIKQLLNMRSGLASYTNTPELGTAVDKDPTRAWKPQELLDLAFRNPPHNAPDAGFYYSNTNTVLLGLIAEQLDGKPLDRVLHDRLFGPLGMHDTFLPKSTSSTIPAPHTRGYLYGTNAIFLRIDTTLPPEMQAQLDAGTLPLRDVTDENPSWGWAAGAGISTAKDMVTWIEALVDGKVLDAKYQKLWLDHGQATDPTQPNGIHYGLAHYSIATPNGSTLYGHSGEIPGYNTWMLRDPKNKVTIVGWANLAPNHGDEAYVGRLIGQIYRPAPQADTHDVQFTPVTQAVASPPRWFQGDDGQVHLQYELLLTNAVSLPVDVRSVEVRADGHTLTRLTGDQLQSAFAPLGSERGTSTVLPPSSVGIVWIDLDLHSPSAVPQRLSHRLTIDVGEGLAVGPIVTTIGAPTFVTSNPPVVINPPLRGGRWVAVGGADGPHRRALQPINGRLRLSQRYAVDFSALLDHDGLTHAGDPSMNASYFAYGQEVLAVGTGTVVVAVDRYADQTPNRHSPLPADEQDGNHVIIRLAAGVYAGYAHLAPGSVRVRPGDHVRAGQVIGSLGNTGASTGPHLHFQLMDQPSILAADGLPFTFSTFRFDGTIPSLKGFIDADATGTPVAMDPGGAGPRRHQGEAGISVLTFSGHPRSPKTTR